MNALRTDRQLNGATWRRRYRAAFSTLLHLKLTLQTLALPDDPAPEQLSQVELDRFLLRLLSDLLRFSQRELRLLEATGRDLRSWRVGELLPLLQLFDETADLAPQALPEGVRASWRSLKSVFIRLKAEVVHRHIWC